MNIKIVTVIGANGTLGIGVSSMFASFGNARVYMVARTMEKANEAIKKAGMAVKAGSICGNMIPKTYEDAPMCIQESDLIIETIVEEYKQKEVIHKMINDNMKNTAIASSVTSGISINELSSAYNDKNKRSFIGIHFFNPPYSLQLCELISSNNTDKVMENELERYLIAILQRKVVKTKDQAGFLANRIGFQFINQAMQYALEYKEKGGIDYIDTILGCFTGRNMPPLYTANFVGLDVHKAIVDNIYENTNDYAHETFKLPNYVEELVKKGMCGIKTGEGLYRNNGKEVFDIKTNTYRDVKKYNIPFIDKVIEMYKIGEYEKGIQIIIEDTSEEAKICMDFLIRYIVYAIYTATNIANVVSDCDTAMAEGFNWIPPYELIRLIGKDKCKQIAMEKINKQIVEEVFNENIESKYNYTKFLKAKR